MTITRPTRHRGFKGIGRLCLALGTLLLMSDPLRALSLDPDTGVIPKVFTPNADGANDAVCFLFNNPRLIEPRGWVIDRRGADVADLRPATAACGPTPFDATDLMWDGRDRAGRTVPPGPYVYHIEGDGAVFSGVVVVVK